MKKLLFAFTLVVTPAMAEPINFSTTLLGLDDKPFTECIRLSTDRSKCEEEVKVTLGWMARLALDMPEDKILLADIVKRGLLSEKIRQGDNIDLSVDERKLVKDQIAKLNYRVGVKFQAIKLIDPKGTEDAKSN